MEPTPHIAPMAVPVLVFIVLGWALMVFVAILTRGAKLGCRLHYLPVVDQAGQGQGLQAPPAHWTLRKPAAIFFAWLQCVLAVLMLSALAADSWSLQGASDYYGPSVRYGLVGMHTNGTFVSYTKWCGNSLDNKDTWDCPPIRGGVAFTFIMALSGFLASLTLAVKCLLCTFVPHHPAGQWKEWMSRLAQMQAVQLPFAVLMYAIIPHLLLSFIRTVDLGPSWGLILVSTFLSWFSLYYFRVAIEYRPAAEAAFVPLGQQPQQQQQQFAQFASPAGQQYLPYAQPIGGPTVAAAYQPPEVHQPAPSPSAPHAQLPEGQPQYSPSGFPEAPHVAYGQPLLDTQ